MENKDLWRSVQCGALVSSHMPLLVEVLDQLEGNSVISTYAPRIRPASPWRSQIVEGWHLVSAAYLSHRELRCVLGRDGQVNLYGPGGRPDHTFQIPGAGVSGPSATGLGYVNRIRAIGTELFVCGQSRQVYRFDWDGRDLASGRWVDFAGPMRQPSMPEPPDGIGDGDALDQWLDDHDAIDLVDIVGFSATDVYALGDEAWHFDGRLWRRLSLPTDEPLAAATVLDTQRVVMVGHNGTVLLGNARDGFEDLSGVDDNQNFIGVEWFNDRLYLASNLGLYALDPSKRRIEPCPTNLQPDLQDTHVLEARDGVLWSFGFKDLAWFDGQRWTRVDHPDNPPIR